jgi:uncharacterized pyridoxamine 5'-phosphate oxidase family protein
MDFKSLKKFVKDVRWGVLATTDGKTVGVRPMGSFVWVGKELWCGAEKGQEKIAQLAKVPFAEYCFSDSNGEHIRIAGPCRVSTNNEDKIKLFSLVLSLHKFYNTPYDKALVVLRMRPTKIRQFCRKTYVYKNIRIK